MDNDAVLDCFDDSLEHRILPKSIGRPVLNKKQYGDYFRGIISFFKEIRIGLFEVVEAGDKMTIHGSGTGESITGTPYKNEFMIIMHFTSPAPNGETKICLVKEFVDGMSTVKFFTDERTKAREKAQAETKAKTREAEVRAQARAAAFSSR
ncbi:hypothetical protein BDQ17DRAFT_720999 [Cyathus striatus]|nr:hypothetical protein BDQ17DRAFT_720999 [Cyathus striatus]